MAQRYRTIAAHTRCRASVLVFVVFCVHMHSFAGLIRRTPPPTFNDTAITHRHSDTLFFQLRAHWGLIYWSIGSEKLFGYVPPVGVESSATCVQGKHPIPGVSLRGGRWGFFPSTRALSPACILEICTGFIWKTYEIPRLLCLDPWVPKILMKPLLSTRPGSPL